MIKAFILLYLLIFLIVFLIKFCYWLLKGEGEFDIATETFNSFTWPSSVWHIITNII